MEEGDYCNHKKPENEVKNQFQKVIIAISPQHMITLILCLLSYIKILKLNSKISDLSRPDSNICISTAVRLIEVIAKENPYWGWFEAARSFAPVFLFLAK